MLSDLIFCRSSHRSHYPPPVLLLLPASLILFELFLFLEFKPGDVSKVLWAVFSLGVGLHRSRSDISTTEPGMAWLRP